MRMSVSGDALFAPLGGRPAQLERVCLFRLQGHGGDIGVHLLHQHEAGGPSAVPGGDGGLIDSIALCLEEALLIRKGRQLLQLPAGSAFLCLHLMELHPGGGDGRLRIVGRAGHFQRGLLEVFHILPGRQAAVGLAAVGADLPRGGEQGRVRVGVAGNGMCKPVHRDAAGGGIARLIPRLHHQGLVLRHGCVKLPEARAVLFQRRRNRAVQRQGAQPGVIQHIAGKRHAPAAALDGRGVREAAAPVDLGRVAVVRRSGDRIAVIILHQLVELHRPPRYAPVR